MKKPQLINFSNEVLILLATQRQEKILEESVMDILIERYSDTYLSFFELYIKMSQSKGIEKKALSNALAIRIDEEKLAVSEEFLDELIPNLSIDRLWILGNNEHLAIREKARERLFEIMDSLEKDETKPVKEKVKNK